MKRLGLVGGYALSARLLQVEGTPRLGSGNLREDPARGPVDLGREVRDAVQQPRRQIACAHKRYAPHGRKREHVMQRAVRGALRDHLERLGEIGQPMCAQPRQPDTRDLQRVDPLTAKCMRSRDPLEKRSIKRRVVRHDVSPADKLNEPRDHAFGARLACEHVVGDAGELRDLQRQRHERVDERVKRRDDLGSAHHGCRNFDDPIAVAVVAGGLDIEHHDLVLEAEPHLPGALGKRLVGRDHVRVGTRNEEAMQGGFSHSARVACEADRDRPRASYSLPHQPHSRMSPVRSRVGRVERRIEQVGKPGGERVVERAAEHRRRRDSGPNQLVAEGDGHEIEALQLLPDPVRVARTASASGGTHHFVEEQRVHRDQKRAVLIASQQVNSLFGASLVSKPLDADRRIKSTDLPAYSPGHRSPLRIARSFSSVEGSFCAFGSAATSSANAFMFFIARSMRCRRSSSFIRARRRTT